MAAASPTAPSRSTPAIAQLENLDRGAVAAVTQNGVFISWRLLGSEVTGTSTTGVTGTDFSLYRDDTKIATVTDSTNYLDSQGTGANSYRIVPVVNGIEIEAGTTVEPWSSNHLDLPLQKPADGVTPTGQAYTYSANDISAADVDGDGALEYVVKWYPSNAKDVSQVGYTGNTYLDTYELDGTLLHRIDLGINIRSGAHYTQFNVYDFDGDGKAEIMMKTAPGTTSTPYRNNSAGPSSYITMPAADRDAGYSDTDDYRMSAQDYYDHLVTMFKGWSAHPEVVAGHWPSTLEEAFGIEPKYDYPLSDADARTLADYFIDVYAPARSSNNKLRAFEGYILQGPEYLTVFDGQTGKELDTVPYEPGRHDDGLMWGDYKGSRIEPGNRVDRFLSGVAYLDGQHPSSIFSRGYYSRTAVAAYDWNGKKLQKRWLADSGWTPSTNPFQNGSNVGTDPELGKLAGQGFHSLSAADVDGDGKQEIVYGSATLDDDGSLLYSSWDVMPPGTPTAGELRPLGHGDAMHVTDIDPARPGLEIFTVHETTNAPYGMAMRRAEDGTVIFGQYAGRDIGRGMIGDVVPGSPGLESWSGLPDGSGDSGVRTPDGDTLPMETPGTNMSIKWAADMTTQLVRGSGTTTPFISDVQRGTLLTAEGTLANNSTKGNPGLVGDVFGDWREELLVRTTDSSAIRIYTSTEVTNHKLYTLLHDTQYRAELARQQTGYNQPTYTGFYFASDTNFANVPLPKYWAPGSATTIANKIEALADQGGLSRGTAAQAVAHLRNAERAAQARQYGTALQSLAQTEKALDNNGVPEAARTELLYDVRLIQRMLG
ncbi:rhamnogalacturonan lyase [Arthrobacter sp. StoSoilB5]|uniref:rhamnogalacturonan lyase n=1 Tax=Arthrobacter sp. StoSoilB5 TaxID=2830992 RepID=UPI001CC46BA7|nr:rhamnogalacturonan lyase [Arthrobacter sp. StoSoilB5]